MLKKTVLLLILAAIAVGGAFAEDSVWNTSFDFNSGPTPHKGALFVDLSYSLYYLFRAPPGFGIGLGWEGRINDSSTYLISGNFGIYGDSWNSYYTYGKTSYTAFDFGIDANYRYYFFKSALDKLFINGGLGFGMKTHNYIYERNHDDTNYTWGSLNIPVYAGYKIIIGPGFVLEAHAGYHIGIPVFSPADYPFTALNFLNFSDAIFGVAVGWAF